jgi:hypothetical protein
MNCSPLIVAVVQDNRTTGLGQQDCRHQARINLAERVVTESGLQPGLFSRGNHPAQTGHNSAMVLVCQNVMQRPEGHGTSVMRRNMQNAALQHSGHPLGRRSRYDLKPAHSLAPPE